MCSGGAQGKKERQEDESLSFLPPKLVEKLVWFPVISFCKIFIPSYTFDALLYYAKTGRSQALIV